MSAYGCQSIQSGFDISTEERWKLIGSDPVFEGSHL